MKGKNRKGINLINSIISSLKSIIVSFINSKNENFQKKWEIIPLVQINAAIMIIEVDPRLEKTIFSLKVHRTKTSIF